MRRESTMAEGPNKWPMWLKHRQEGESGERWGGQ